MVREGGLDLRCGGGHLGLRHAPGMSLSALGFKSHHCKKKTAILADDCFFLVREGGLEPPRPEWTLEPESSESTNSTTRASESLTNIALIFSLVNRFLSVFKKLLFAVYALVTAWRV